MKPTEPTANLLNGCITGIKRLKPPRGTLGKKAASPPVEWLPLDKGGAPLSTAKQEKPGAKGTRDVQKVLAQSQGVQKDIAAALSSVGFSLTWQSVPAADVRFRELQADPLTGAVAA
jgi:hypothetical protein